MKSKIITAIEEDALIVVKLLIQNGYTVKVYQTDETLVQNIIEFWKDIEVGWQE